MSAPRAGLERTFPDDEDFVRWVAGEAQISLDLTAEPVPLGDVYLADLTFRRVDREDPCAFDLGMRRRDGRSWRRLRGPADAALSLELVFDEGVLKGVARLTGHSRDPVWKVQLWPSWVVRHVRYDGRDLPPAVPGGGTRGTGRSVQAGYHHADGSLYVAIPPGDATLEVAFDGPAWTEDAELVDLLGVSLFWVEDLRSTTLTLTSAGARHWTGAEVMDEGTRVRAQWDGPDALLWSLSGSRTPRAVSRSRGASVASVEARAAAHPRLLARALATLDEAERLGLDPPPTVALSDHAASFSRAGRPTFLGPYVFEDPAWEHVVGHELGHLLFFGEPSVVDEAIATWVSGWVQDPDGAWPQHLWRRVEDPRCPLLAPHAETFDLDVHASGHLLTLLEDRIGRQELATRLRRRSASTWSAVLETLEPPDAAWLESWLRAGDWPQLRVASTADGVEVVDDASTGLTGRVEVDIVTVTGTERRVVGFPGAVAPLPDAVSGLVLDPRGRVPLGTAVVPP